MMRIASSFRFLAAQLTPGPCAMATKTQLAQLPWEKIVGLANWHQVTPALWCGLRSRGIDKELPAEAQEFLSFLHAQNIHRNQHLRRQIIEAAWALNAIGVEPLLLKGGAYLLLDLFGDPGARILADIDLLVPVEQLQQSWEVLYRLGYTADNEEIERFSNRNHHHLASLSRPGDHASIEIHHRPLHDRAGAFLTAGQMWQKSIPLETAGARLRVPEPTALVLHNILHSQLVDFHHDRGFTCLRHLHDLAYLQHRFGTQVDWAEIEAVLSSTEVNRILHDYLHLAHHLVSLPTGLVRGKSYFSFLHLGRCMANLQWPGLADFDRRLQNFRARYVLNRYQLPDTAKARIVGRLRYTGYLLRRTLCRVPKIVSPCRVEIDPSPGDQGSSS
jgi:hypothetical protein